MSKYIKHGLLSLLTGMPVLRTAFDLTALASYESGKCLEAHRKASGEHFRGQNGNTPVYIYIHTHTIHLYTHTHIISSR